MQWMAHGSNGPNGRRAISHVEVDGSSEPENAPRQCTAVQNAREIQRISSSATPTTARVREQYLLLFELVFIIYC